MTTVYLITLGLALVATLAFVVLYLRDRFLAPRGFRGADGAARWADGALDRVLVLFAISAAGMLIGLLLSGSDIDVLDLGAEAMLLAAGATSSERIVARQRRDGNGERAAVPGVCLAAGLIGGLVGLGP